MTTDKRLDSVREHLQQMIMSIDSAIRRQEACVQLYGVSTFASMIAMRRGYDQELAEISGLLHHYYYYKTGVKEFPGANSAEAVRPWIRDLKIFTKEEQLIIQQAIFYWEDRSKVHGPYDEIVKDAYVLQCYFQNTSRSVSQQDAVRLRQVLRELGIPEKIVEEAPCSDRENLFFHANRRSKLADIAEALAGDSIIGVPGDERYREVCQHWPDPDIYKVLQNSWCAAFVYHCCRQVGLRMPIRYPNGICRFAGVGAWLEWAQLPETGFLHYDQDGFTPQRGDIVIYEKLLSDDSHDHIGIVLASDDQEIRVAEGNRDNQNYSCVFHRDRRHCILGYIRIADDYQFQFSGSYNPIL
ncbi:CHAP domain-containing protein [Paenibacillus baekrokdamisoli]|uniref:CHAP domain-containing protein n=1 Tax=Paenibacillus baekrokdamisoli TaxID=1712516 RepID=UPI001E615D0E|nr:CHAP domain-containing protein [Paenibacillus baekrokdamisoli]